MSRELQPDRLGGAQPARVHQLQQRPVAQRQRLGPPRLAEQPRHLSRVSAARQALGACAARAAPRSGRARSCPRGAGGGRTSAGTRPCAGASRRRRRYPRSPLRLPRRRPFLLLARGLGHSAGGQLRQKRREIAVLRLQRIDVMPAQELAELQQVRAVGLQRVARQAPLELQIGEEVEHQRLDHLLRPGLPHRLAGIGDGRRDRLAGERHALRRTDRPCSGRWTHIPSFASARPAPAR